MCKHNGKQLNSLPSPAPIKGQGLYNGTTGNSFCVIYMIRNEALRCELQSSMGGNIKKDALALQVLEESLPWAKSMCQSHWDITIESKDLWQVNIPVSPIDPFQIGLTRGFSSQFSKCCHVETGQPSTCHSSFCMSRGQDSMQSSSAKEQQCAFLYFTAMKLSKFRVGKFKCQSSMLFLAWDRKCTEG